MQRRHSANNYNFDRSIHKNKHFFMYSIPFQRVNLYYDWRNFESYRFVSTNTEIKRTSNIASQFMLEELES